MPAVAMRPVASMAKPQVAKPAKVQKVRASLSPMPAGRAADSCQRVHAPAHAHLEAQQLTANMHFYTNTLLPLGFSTRLGAC